MCTMLESNRTRWAERTREIFLNHNSRHQHLLLLLFSSASSSSSNRRIDVTSGTFDRLDRRKKKTAQIDLVHLHQQLPSLSLQVWHWLHPIVRWQHQIRLQFVEYVFVNRWFLLPTKHWAEHQFNAVAMNILSIDLPLSTFLQDPFVVVQLDQLDQWRFPFPISSLAFSSWSSPSWQLYSRSTTFFNVYEFDCKHRTNLEESDPNDDPLVKKVRSALKNRSSSSRNSDFSTPTRTMEISRITETTRNIFERVWSDSKERIDLPVLFLLCSRTDWWGWKEAEEEGEKGKIRGLLVTYRYICISAYRWIYIWMHLQ